MVGCLHYIQQTASNVIAGIGNRQSVDSSDTERGNVVYQAKAVDIDNAMDKYTNQSEQKFKQSGLTVSVSNSLVDSAQNIDRLIDAANNTSSPRMKGLAAISAGLKAEALYGEGKQAAKALQTGNLKDVGNTRIQATIGSSKSQSNSQSYSEQSQGSSIQAANNLAIIATGAGKDSNININASDITVGNNALFKTDNDLNINGVAQNEQTRSNNKSSSFGIGAYASTNPGKEGASFGITANASKGKGHANSDGTTYANSHINVGGTTTFDIGNDVNIKGGVLTTDELTGQVAGDLNMESLQDTYVYDSKQKNAGFSADIDLSGNAQANSLSINGGKTNIDADYAAVTEQTAINTQQSDLNVGGKGRFKGAAFTTASAEDNRSVFAQGIETLDIENHSNYDAKAIAAGLTIGKAKDTHPEASLNGIGYGTDSDSQSSTTKAAVTGMAGQSDVTTATKDSLNEPLENTFDASTVNEELGAQVEITRAFDQERRKIKTELNKDEQELRDAAKEQEALGNLTARNELLEQANKVQQKALLFDGISSALYGPNTNGATGYVAKAVSPQVAYQIGQVFKENDLDNAANNTNLAGEGSPEHLLAHALLGAAVSAATGNDALTGGISASSGEVTATLLSKYIYQVDKPSELTAEQKNTISNITTLAGVAIGSTTGEVTDAVNAGETAKVAVEDNGHEVIPLEEFEEIKNNPNYSREQLEAIRRIPETIGSLNIVFKKNDKGQFIVCVPYGSNSCAPRSNERYASSSEVKQGFQDFALDVVPIPGGKGAAVVVKKTGQVVGKYKDVKAAKKAANDAVEKARIENNVNRDNDLLSNQPLGGAHRANKYSHNWQKASLSDARRKFVGNNPEIIHTKTGKIIHKNRQTGIEVVYDKEGDYFTIIDPSISGKRKYLDLDGNIPNNKTLPNGKQVGRSKEEYREATHFKVDR